MPKRGQPKTAFVCALPFHRWILDGLALEMQHSGWRVKWFVHRPAGPQDWLSKHMQKGGSVYTGLAKYKPDVIVVAEYPVDHFRKAVPNASIVATRHSLAARGNTWEFDYLEADHILTWSQWDDAEWGRRHGRVFKDELLLRSGCVWASWSNDEKWSIDRPLVTWCPTWNVSFNCREQVMSQLEDLYRWGWRIGVRPHPATAWREPGWVEHLRLKGWIVSDPLAIPKAVLTQSDVLVTDVSGIGLWALGIRDADLPVVWIDPSHAKLRDCAQHDPRGPEWTFRSAIGQRCPLGRGMTAAVLNAHENDQHVVTRRETRDTILGAENWTRKACTRATKLIGKATGIGAHRATTS